MKRKVNNLVDMWRMYKLYKIYKIYPPYTLRGIKQSLKLLKMYLDKENIA